MLLAVATNVSTRYLRKVEWSITGVVNLFWVKWQIFPIKVLKIFFVPKGNYIF